MQLIDEYRNQQAWRNWPQYLHRIPIRPGDTVLDLGCSVGAVTELLSPRCHKVVGIDLQAEFIAFCQAWAHGNQEFICADFSDLDLAPFGSIHGIWSSFALSYLARPHDYLKTLYRRLEPGAWIALLDVACFLSGNCRPQSPWFSRLRQYELESGKSGLYDFDYGAKMDGQLREAGFIVEMVDDDVIDSELNFDGPASADVLRNWQARLARLQGLRTAFAADYQAVCQELISSLQAADHQKNHNLRFVLGRKPR